MGTPEFAVPSLELLLAAGYQISCVVTSPGKPAGRGLALREPAIKQYAQRNGMQVLQPASLHEVSFISALEATKPDLIVVVAFRKLPEIVWSIPSLGAINLHASLLPQYRGAAPINWAIINGETETGVTTFFINEVIDSGRILYSEKVPVLPEDNAGTLHNRLMEKGARLLVKTVNAIRDNGAMPVAQSELVRDGALKPAPKITKEHCLINWNRKATDVVNLIRGLSPYPGAFSVLKRGNGRKQSLRILEAVSDPGDGSPHPGKILTDNNENLLVGAINGYVRLLRVQLEGRKELSVREFLRGFRWSSDCCIVPFLEAHRPENKQ